MINNLVRGIFRLGGLEVFRRKTMPRGVALEVDLERLIPRPRVIFDVGANVGQTAIRLASLFPTAEVYAFEPVRETFVHLARNTRFNPHIKPQKVAMGASDGKAKMKIAADSTWNRIVTEAENGSSKLEDVTLRSVDPFCQEHGIQHLALLKTDCEGFDMEVLKGASRMLAEQKIDCIYCEVNFLRDGRHGDFYDIDAYLRQFNYVFYGLYDYSGWQYDVGQEGFTNALFVAPRVAARA